MPAKFGEQFLSLVNRVELIGGKTGQNSRERKAEQAKSRGESADEKKIQKAVADGAEDERIAARSEDEPGPRHREGDERIIEGHEKKHPVAHVMTRSQPTTNKKRAARPVSRADADRADGGKDQQAPHAMEGPGPIRCSEFLGEAGHL